MRIALGVVITAVSLARADVPGPFVQDEVLTIPNTPQVTAMAWAPDDSNRLFVTGKAGHLWIVKDNALVPQTAYKFVSREEDDAGELEVSSECGLLGIAFDPAFVTNGFIYVFVTLHVPAGTNNIEQQIIRFTMVGDTATDRTPIITGLPSRGRNHDGGGLAFGPDGLLYWAVGDNGGAGLGHGDDLVSPASKVGRTSPVPSAPPPPGPFNDGAGPNFDYTFARSLRNPYTMTFHPVTGALWVNIVGEEWEQVYVLAEGDHVGFPAENVEPGTSGATVSPRIAYRTGAAADVGVGASAAVRANGVVTITTVDPHGLRKGGAIDMTGIDDPTFNGSFHVASVLSATSFTYLQAGTDATSGLGAVRGADYGFVVLGGAFYDATAFPLEYRQNFFFGDFGTGQLVRVETAPDTTISRVSAFGTNTGRHIDTTTGPDGSLWIINHDGDLRRVRYVPSTQGIVVSPQNLRLAETSRGFIAVRLAMAPVSSVAVTLTRTSGSTFVAVPSGTVTFTPANWDQPQYVEVTTAIDGDTAEDVATFEATAAGIPTETVTVRVTDTRDADPSVIDTPSPVVDGPGTNTSSSGCCGVGESANGPFAISALVGWILVRRRRRRAW